MNGERKGVVVVIAKINVDLPATEKTIEFGRPSLQLSPGNKAREEAPSGKRSGARGLER